MALRGIEISATGTVLHSFYKAYANKLIKEVMKGPVPEHIAIIMDGNRRFAERIGMNTAQGHAFGKSRLEKVLEWAEEIGVKILTVYGFSTENFTRTDEEIDELMDLFERSFTSVVDDERIKEKRVRITAIGAIESLPERVQKAIRSAEEATKDNTNFRLNIAIAYGGREELISAFKAIGEQIEKGEITADSIDQDIIAKHLYTSGMPDPDLVLRTSGEVRVSNFLLWQLAYSELYFSDVYWPDFRRVDFLRAVRTYQKRKRRYGT